MTTHNALKVILFVLFTSLTSCLTSKPPEFKTANHIKVSNSHSEQQIDFDVVGYNPNNWSVRINEINTMVTIQGQSFVNVKTDTVIRLKRETDFSIPLSVKISEKEFKKIIPSGVLTLLLGEISR